MLCFDKESPVLVPRSCPSYSALFWMSEGFFPPTETSFKVKYQNVIMASCRVMSLATLF